MRLQPQIMEEMAFLLRMGISAPVAEAAEEAAAVVVWVESVQAPAEMAELQITPMALMEIMLINTAVAVVVAVPHTMIIRTIKVAAE